MSVSIPIVRVHQACGQVYREKISRSGRECLAVEKKDVNGYGISTTGRATVEVLKLNRPSILLIRGEEAMRGRFPP